MLPSNRTVDPIQNEGIAAKSGIVFGVTVTLRVWFVAHCPAFGVKVYMPLVVLLIVAGNQIPVIPFGEVFPKMGATLPEQNVGIAEKFGFMVAGFTITLSVWVVAHCPGLGVKTYVPLAVLLIIAGLHVPVIPFGEVFPKIGGTEPVQNGGIEGKLGVILGVTVTFKV